MVVTVGDTAPDFTLLDSNENEFNSPILMVVGKSYFSMLKMVHQLVREDV